MCEARDVCVQGEATVLWGCERVCGECGAAVCEGRDAVECGFLGRWSCSAQDVGR